ncbi:hypothetical protein FSPOR_4795 [Fusarium sporotrichioides]|uniref:Uncharacterized protein n=1 Tax=Fusarium sporotrichioides TaxID=5514 RepID=A0A395SA74_FUSSP|nr:hypothetical protein FSPOR_4795 [Fusarium sporotrichioides]
MSNSTTTTAINSNWQQHRSYAVSKGPRAPLRKPPRAPKLAPSQSQSQPESRPNISLAAIARINQILTPEVFEKGIQRCKGIIIDTLAPEDYYKHAMNYLEAVLKGEDPGRANLAAIGISPETAHDIGCLVYGDSSRDIENLGRSLFASASATNYNPSTITLARFLFRTDYWGFEPQFKHVENRFMKLVYEGKDCNALAVYGEHLFMSRKYAAAVPILNQAISVDDGIFEWKNTCMLCLAKSYARLGKVKAAEDVLEDLGDPDAWVELGPLLDRGGSEDKRQWLLREGFRGRMEAYRELAEIDFEKASKETDKAEKREHNLWAMEWSRLADPKAEY